MSEVWLFCGFIGLVMVALAIMLFPFRGSIRTAWVFIPIAVAFVVLAYGQWGGLPDWRAYRQKEEHQAQAKAMLKSLRNPDDVVQRLKEKLASDPQNSQGWYLLGRLYASGNRWQKAHDAFKSAYTLKPNDIPIILNYAQSLWQLNHQVFNRKIRTLFQSVLEKNSNQPDALAMLAMDAFLRHSYRPAIAYWQRLLTLVPPQSEDAKTIRKAIAKAQRKMISK